MITLNDGIATENGKPIVLRILNIEPLPGYNLRAEFPDGTVKIYDFSKLLEHEVFSPLCDEEKFKKVVLDHGVPTWEEINADISPETIYFNGK